MAKSSCTILTTEGDGCRDKVAPQGIAMRRFAAAILLMVSGCATVPLAAPDTDSSYIYRLGPGDRLKITTYREDSLSGEFTISDSGVLAFPLLGNVVAKGKTTDELTEQMTIALGTRFVKNPRINISVIEMRPVYILGEVGKPGDYPYTSKMTVMMLIARAGGFTYRANRGYVYLRHEGETDEKRYSLAGALPVHPGDVVRVGERYF
jgi:polysaccharide export outer membrane protein